MSSLFHTGRNFDLTSVLLRSKRRFHQKRITSSSNQYNGISVFPLFRGILSYFTNHFHWSGDWIENGSVPGEIPGTDAHDRFVICVKKKNRGFRLFFDSIKNITFTGRMYRRRYFSRDPWNRSIIMGGVTEFPEPRRRFALEHQSLFVRVSRCESLKHKENRCFVLNKLKSKLQRATPRINKNTNAPHSASINRTRSCLILFFVIFVINIIIFFFLFITLSDVDGASKSQVA